MTQVKIHESWMKVLQEEFGKEYFGALSQFVKNEILAGQVIYPHPKNIFAAFDQTPFDQVRVVLLGQDPYHGPGQAHGLSFSVQEGIRNPPSLVNIFKELESERDAGSLSPGNLSPIPSPKERGAGNITLPLRGRDGVGVSGDLTHWAHQGVLLLNTTLTVRAGQPMSHAGKGWETFTDAVIRTLSDKRDFLIFWLWGSHAQKKKTLIDTNKHTILEAPHPSPLSAHRGFLGCGHFSKTNALLREHGLSEIQW